jgi:hypothetical protein
VHDVRRATLHRIVLRSSVRRNICIIIVEIINPATRRAHTLLSDVEVRQRSAPLGAGRGLLIPGTQILTGGYIIDTQISSKRRCTHTEDDSEIDGLGLPPGTAETLHDEVVIIPTVLKSSNHLGVAGARREDAQLELRIVNVNKSATFWSAEKTAEFRVGQDILQIRIGTGVTHAADHTAARR